MYPWGSHYSLDQALTLAEAMAWCHHLNGLVQERRNSIANALEVRLSCTNPSIWFYVKTEIWCQITCFQIAEIMPRAWQTQNIPSKNPHLGFSHRRTLMGNLKGFPQILPWRKKNWCTNSIIQVYSKCDICRIVLSSHFYPKSQFNKVYYSPDKPMTNGISVHWMMHFKQDHLNSLIQPQLQH